LRPGDSFAPYAQIFAHSDAAAQAIVNGDENAVVTGEEAESGNVLKYEVQKDGTLGPIRSGK
jgi:hypothetical protein